MALGKRAMDWVDVRLGVRELWRNNLTEYRIPRDINAWYTLGSVLLALFALQIGTGLLLLVDYVPEPTKAFDSVEKIMNEVPYGWLVRDLHAVGANLIVVVLLLHMASTLFTGSYKKPRELNWLSGFLLLLLGLGLCLTGYLLPWSQLSFWATTIATDAAGAVPVVGEGLMRFLRGASAVGSPTLGRFFALHVLGLPLLLGATVVLHLFCVRRTGISQPPFGRGSHPARVGASYHHEHYAGGIPFYPNYVVKDLAVISFFLAVLAAFSFFAPYVFIPADALVPANPFSTPAHIKPEWYFLWAYEILRLSPNKLFGLSVQALVVLFLALLPFLDRSRERNPRRRPPFVVLFVLGILVLIGLSLWGRYT